MPSGTDAHRLKVSTHVCKENVLLYTIYAKSVVSDITVWTTLFFNQMASQYRSKLLGLVAEACCLKLL